MTVNICKVSEKQQHMWNASSLLPLDFFVNIDSVVLGTEPLEITRQCGFNLDQTSLFSNESQKSKNPSGIYFAWDNNCVFTIAQGICTNASNAKVVDMMVWDEINPQIMSN